MRKLINTIKNGIERKIKRLKDILANTFVYQIYYKSSIDENLVYLESQNGQAFNGNILRICEELHKTEYNNLKIILKVTHESMSSIDELIKNYNLYKVKLVDNTMMSLFYMERAKYIFLDAGVQGKYVKKDGQIFINVWHGTPFKYMGKSTYAERHSIGNLQRNFLMCDYILFPNRYMQEIFLKDYMIENIWNGKSILSGYPRNSVFFDSNRRTMMKEKLGLGNKQIFAYLPTHRGTIFNLKNTEQKNRVEEYLEDIDQRLNDNQVLIVKMHLYNNQDIDCKKYRHIINFPKGYETYDILNIIDCLITDYSSVFFDFVNLKKKIVLFTYDVEEYFSDRGVYFPLEDLPFPKVKTIDDLIKEINTPINYDDISFLETYCKFESIDSAKNLCRHVIFGEEICLQEPAPYNNKENVLIYAGSLEKNGITSSLFNALKSLDLNKRNYILTFYRSSVKTPDKTLIIPSNVPYIIINADPSFTLFEKIAHKMLLNSKKKIDNINCFLERLYKREITKQFYKVKFDRVIQFDGYTKNAMLLFSFFDCKKTVYVHNDMMQEIYLKHNQSYPILNYIYRVFDNVAIVSKDIFEPTKLISEKSSNIKVVSNFFDHEGVIEKSNQDIEFDRDTEMLVFNKKGIEGILNSDGVNFINIGRFSPEKGHLKLLEAFERFWSENKDAKLIIIGGYGKEYKKIVSYVRKLNCWNNVVIIKSMKNPMPILKKCDLFVLSSSYEGLPVVFFEADCLGVPVLSTDIKGPREFINKQEGGLLVEESVDGLYKGMQEFKKGNIKLLNIDMKSFNKKCLEEFENCFD